MGNVSEQQKNIAKHLAMVFSVDKPPIIQYWDDQRKSDVYLLQAENVPQLGVTSFATIGLSDHPLFFEGKEFEARVELVGACHSGCPNYANVLATAAFCIINSKWFCAPGMIFPGVLDMYDLSSTMSDIYFAHPFLWGDRLMSTILGGRTIAWLLAVPVSKAETEFARKFGPKKLEELFVEKDIDIFNLNRASVI